MKYREKIVTSGHMVEKIVAPAFDAKTGSRGAKRELSPQEKEQNRKRNRRVQVRRLTRLLAANFEVGIHVVLTCREDAREKARSDYAVKSFLRRVNSLEGRNLGAVWVREHVDTDVHYHIVMEPAMTKNIRAAWPFGFVHVDALYTQDMAPLAEYLLKEEATAEGKRVYHPTRGLKQPIEQVTFLDRVGLDEDDARPGFLGLPVWYDRSYLE